MHEIEELRLKQSLPLDLKIKMTERRIREFYQYFGGQVYVSCSGGKDSLVLQHIARKMYPSMKSVFADTGLEYPEVQAVIKTIENIDIIYPVMYNRKKRKYERVTFKQVIEKYGFPLISKEQAQFIWQYRHAKSEKTKATRLNGNKWGRGKISDKWQFLINAPFEISDKCCEAMKKMPFHLYEKETGLHPILAVMAEESNQRTSQWLKNGCNTFDDSKRQTSKPMSFWTEQDVLEYIVINDLDIAECYGNVVGISDKLVFGRGTMKKIMQKSPNTWKKRVVLKTTKCDRTGCMFCMFGCHLEKEPNRFQRMKETHPKQYNFCIYKLGLGKVLDYINVPY